MYYYQAKHHPYLIRKYPDNVLYFSWQPLVNILLGPIHSQSWIGDIGSRSIRNQWVSKKCFKDAKKLKTFQLITSKNGVAVLSNRAE